MKTIEVIPNPYAAIDADGVPQGVVGLPGARGAWIGAVLDAVASRESGKSRFYFPGANARRNEKSIAGMRVVTLDVDDANVRATIANAILEGSLLAVTKEEAAKVGILNDFLDAAKALERECERATADFRAMKNDKTAKLADVPHEATPESIADAEEAPKAPAAGGTAVKVTANVKLTHSTEA